MPKQTFLSRYSLIIKRLEKSPATFQEIANYLECEADIQDKDFTISIRTFQRDIKDIYEQLDIEIANERKGDKRYYIKERGEDLQRSQRLLDSYQTINAIKASQEFHQYVFLETRKPKGLEHFYGLLYAIKSKLILKFKHYKYWDDTLTERKVHPLALKESQGRWYLLAIDTKDAAFKTFGLDRIDELEITKTKFKEKYNYDFNEMFSNCFGILNVEDGKPQTVQLAFTFQQGQYVKNYPLHHSQKIIKDNGKQIIVELSLAITYDFIQEILHFGEYIKVLQPISLVKEIKTIHKNSFQKYQ
ncbi:MAG: WYL domain-containing protein [Bacteroidetes bacterium]|jgi:predicted DNA-binding transcriptional regulator YafY|nr:WYL domain-containing protein [Bacteroidota bacterium]